jgi:ribosome maturation factor RimP
VPIDSFGSPLVDELTDFSGAFDAALDAAGVSPDELTVEVSSAGAERCAHIHTHSHITHLRMHTSAYRR